MALHVISPNPKLQWATVNMNTMPKWPYNEMIVGRQGEMIMTI